MTTLESRKQNFCFLRGKNNNLQKNGKNIVKVSIKDPKPLLGTQDKLHKLMPKVALKVKESLAT